MLLHEKIPLNYLARISEGMTRWFAIPANYTKALRDYIVYGVFRDIPGAFEIDYSGESNIKGLRYVPVKIYSQLAKDDLDELQKTIRLHAKHLPKFQSVIG